MNPKNKSDKIFEILAGENPEPKTELEYSNLFTLLVAVALSAQTTDISVNKVTKALFKIADNPHEMYKLGVDGIKDHIKTVGLYNTKAKNIHELSRILIDEYKGEVPLEFDNLIKLPGVGRKTANVVLNSFLGAHTMPVDTHVFRVSKKLGIANGKNPEIVEKELLENISTKWLKYAHHWLILHGRYVCKARKPQCSECKLQKYCDFFENS